MTEACRLDPRGNRAETGYFTSTTVPSEYCDCHIIVERDKETGGIATVNCPKQNIEEVGLIQVERNFPIQITVTDAQYVYRALPKGIEPALWWGEAFFAKSLIFFFAV